MASLYRRVNPTGDPWFILIALLLSLIGLAAIWSSSVVVSYERFGYNSYYLIKQAAALGFGLILMIILSQINYQVWKKQALLLMVISIILLIIIFIPGVGLRLGGALRWVDLGIFTVQPSELLKLTLIIYLAAWLEKKGKDITDFQSGVIPFTAMLAIIVFLVIKQPDMGTVLVISAIAAVMFFSSGASLSHIFFGSGFAVVFFYFLIRSADYRWQRFLTFLNKGSDTLGAGYHINQSLIAIGSGGWWGLGFGQSKQKYLYLPQPQTDAIFSIITEELGYLRAMVIIFLYLWLIIKGLNLARVAPDGFARLMAVGISIWIGFQAFTNIAAVSGLVPLTGIPLPFISFGGSSLVVLLAAIGVMYNISKYKEV